MLFLSNFFDSSDSWHYIVPHYILSTQLNKLIQFIWFKRVSKLIKLFCKWRQTLLKFFFERTENLHDDEIQNVHSLSTRLNPQTVKQLWLPPADKFAIYEIYPHLLLSQRYFHFLEKGYRPKHFFKRNVP